jgi:cobalamin biosynthesis protein CobT
MGSKYKNSYTPEQLEFLRVNIAGKPYKELTSMFNECFGTERSCDSIKVQSYRMGFGEGIPGLLDFTLYTDEQIAFLKANISGITYKEQHDYLMGGSAPLKVGRRYDPSQCITA